jgi:hypothetical protein
MMFNRHWFLIQVRQSDKVGHPNIDAFETVMEREAKAATSAASSWHSVIHQMPTQMRRVPQANWTNHLNSWRSKRSWDEEHVQKV